MAGDRLNMSSDRAPSFTTPFRNQRVYTVYSDAQGNVNEDEGRLKNSAAFFITSADEETESNFTQASSDSEDVDNEPYDITDENDRSQMSVVQKKVIYDKFVRFDKKQLQKENMVLFAKLKGAKHKVVTHHSDEYKNKSQRAQKYRIPQQTLDKYREFVETPSPRILRKLIRPRIFLDFEMKRGPRLGRIYIQLFTEACPEVVLEFVRMCMDRNARQMEIMRIYPELCIESELHFTQKLLNEPLFEYDMNVMDHGFSYGILSFAKCYLSGFKTGVLNFSISLKPLSVLNGERIVFGIVTRGLKVIDMLQQLGSGNGRLVQEIKIVKCGMLK